MDRSAPTLAAPPAAPVDDWFDTAEPEFDQITRLAGSFLSASNAQILLVRGDALPVKSEFAARPLSAPDAARAMSLCEQVVAGRQGLVLSALGASAAAAGATLGAFAATPVVAADGAIAGVLWAGDPQPRQWSDQELRVLDELATSCATRLDLRFNPFRRRAAAPRVSVYDELTGLFNRQGFFLFAEQHWKLARRRRGQLLLLILELDGLTRHRARLGEAAADRLLLEAAAVLQETVRDTDIVARVDDGEFAVLALEAGHDGSLAIRQRLDRLVERLNHDPKRALPPVVFHIAPAHVITPPAGVRKAG